MIEVNVADAIYCSPFNFFCHPLDWWSSAASWAQAVLSALAILSAAIIAKSQRDHENREKAAQAVLVARSFSLAVLKDMVELLERIQKSTAPIGNNWGSTEGEYVPPVLIPQHLWDNTDQMYLLGSPATYVLEAIFEIMESRHHLDERSDKQAMLWTEERTSYFEALHRAQFACLRAISEMRKLQR